MPSKKINGKSNQLAKITEEKQNEPMPKRISWTEVKHADEDVIPSAEVLFEETVPIWKGDEFNPKLMNAGTGRLFKSSHHVKGAGAKTKADFRKLVFAFCLEWITLMWNGKEYRVRCLNQFCVQSNGCIDHPRTLFKEGPNSVWPALKAGEIVTYGAIKDHNAPIVEVELTAEQMKQAAKDEYAAVSQEIVDGLDQHLDVDHLYARQTELQIMMSGKHGSLKNAQGLAFSRNPVVSRPNKGFASAKIYNSRTAASNSAPGIPMLDKKNATFQSANTPKARAAASRKFKLGMIEEEGQPPVPDLPQERKKAKKNQGADFTLM